MKHYTVYNDNETMKGVFSVANCLVTTIDNPFNPFTQFDDWYRFDTDHGYFTCEYLARIAKTSNDLSDEANADEINRAVNSIVRMNINGMYKKVYENA